MSHEGESRSTTERVLQRLRSAGGWVSGAEVARDLGISRTAIFKQVQGLRERGYGIESRRHLGYRLAEACDLLIPEEMPVPVGRLGSPYHYHREVSSTSDLARGLLGEGAPHGTLVVAERQTRGRGRLGRTWESLAGEGIWASLVLRPRVPLPEVAPITLLAAVAVVEAVQAETGLELGIKWPNDVLYREQKVAGILTELVAEWDRVEGVILGIGINTTTRTREVGSGLGWILGRPVSRPALLGRLLWHLDRLLGMWEGEGFAAIHPLWLRHQITLGREVEARTPGGTVVGRAVDLDLSGSLRLLTPGGMVVLSSGEVRLRPAGHGGYWNGEGEG